MREIKIEKLNIQIKALKQYFPVVLFVLLYKVVLTFELQNAIVFLLSDPTRIKIRVMRFTKWAVVRVKSTGDKMDPPLVPVLPPHEGAIAS